MGFCKSETSDRPKCNLCSKDKILKLLNFISENKQACHWLSPLLCVGCCDIFFLIIFFLIPFKNEMKKKTLPVRKAHQSWFEIRTVFCAAYIEVHEKSSKCYGSMLYKNKLWAEDCFKKQAGWSHGFYSAVELWHTAGTDARGWLLLPAWTPCFWGRSI